MYVIFVIFHRKRIRLISIGVVYGRCKHGCVIEKEMKLSYLSEISLEVNVSINLNKCFWIMINSFGVTLLFC